ncbi:helix-turn-helix domain-containing protein [Actinoallomurus sp. CA-142502]|uniref:helix-turn-helix domain-containing protein n=1 Tax=Actinoallomurus sp. CA-142502 TaxID=3239885 RepID=UPI003D930D8B
MAERARERSEPKNWEYDAVKLYAQGWSIRQVAQRIGCDYGTIRRVLIWPATLRTRGSVPRRTAALAFEI